MKSLLALLILAAGISRAADVHFTWFPLSSNIPGIPQTATPQTEYGVQVFMDSDNPAITAFEVTVVVQLANGDVRTSQGTVARQAKATNVQYSTIYAFWVDTNSQFQVLAVQVNGVSGQNATRPIPGKDYNNEVRVDKSE